jgi:general secretion pathway protein E
MLADNLQESDADAPPLMLGERLLAAGKLSQRDLERALLAQKEMGGLLGEVLVRLGLVSETDLLAELSTQLGLPIAAKDAYPAMPLRLESMPEHFLLSNRVVTAAGWQQNVGQAMLKHNSKY